MKKIVFFLLLFAVSIFAQSDIAKHFEGINGCFVLYDFNNDQVIKYNEERCAQRFLPASTFKIPNSLIILEEKVIPNENYIIKWDSVDRGWDKWNMDHDLRSAFKYSAVWVYSKLATEVGRKKYEYYLDKLDYGNKTIGDRVDYFWLDWSLQISANEQIEFMKKLVINGLPFSQRSIDIVKDIMIMEETENYVLRAKTGLGDTKDGVYTGWYVGYVEANGNVYAFALNMDESDYEKIKTQVRIDLAKSILMELDIIR